MMGDKSTQKNPGSLDDLDTDVLKGQMQAHLKCAEKIRTELAKRKPIKRTKQMTKDELRLRRRDDLSRILHLMDARIRILEKSNPIGATEIFLRNDYKELTEVLKSYIPKSQILDYITLDEEVISQLLDDVVNLRISAIDAQEALTTNKERIVRVKEE